MICEEVCSFILFSLGKNDSRSGIESLEHITNTIANIFSFHSPASANWNKLAKTCFSCALLLVRRRQSTTDGKHLHSFINSRLIIQALDKMKRSSCYLKLLSLIFKSFEIAPSLASGFGLNNTLLIAVNHDIRSVSLVLLAAILERIDDYAMLVSLLRTNDAFSTLVQILNYTLSSKSTVAPGGT